MSLTGIMRSLKPYNCGYWGQRIHAELTYAMELSKSLGGRHDGLLESASDALLKAACEADAVTKDIALACEGVLSPLAEDAKSLTVHAIGHAHIDMNWMWRYDETVNITLETFRTVLKLMEDFPDFTFSQSQASCYRIVEQYDKILLDKIRELVKSGRWEVAASTWVETDKNMPSGESLARHILYTKRYMNKLFGLGEDELRLDFEPDTFGHNANVPELLAGGGVEYYYHCRGHQDHEIYNWKSPSGASVLVYREPTWYLGGIEPGQFTYIPAFCKRNGVKDIMEVYGVGDHGGGPTRRDLETITDMMSWPVFPKIIFSGYHKYFDTIKPLKDSFPVVSHELNFVFTGCYTTQTRIKAANRLGEAALFEAEALTALSPAKAEVDTSLFEEAWRDVLFNQFHDIIPGSGVIDTREHALGMFQEVLAKANSQKGIVCYAIADMVDTSAVRCGRGNRGTVSEGAGVGYTMENKHNLAHVERGLGLRRGYLLFNTAGEREDVAEFTMWDWPGDPDALRITDSEGNPLDFQILKTGVKFWAHEAMEVAVRCKIPSMGWMLIIADEDSDKEFPEKLREDPRVHKPYEFVLENEYLRAEIDPANGMVGELFDKRTGRIAARNAGFFGLTESSVPWGTAWIVTRYKNDESPCLIDDIEWLHKGGVRNAVKITGRYYNSKITYIISLDKGAKHLTISAQADWLEVGGMERGIPQLHFIAENISYSREFLYDIPFGSVRRAAIDQDVPGQSYACSLPEEGPALALISRDKYAYRCYDGKMSLTLIRSSFDPDPFPELCRHSFTFHLAVPGQADPCYMGALSAKLCHPAFIQSVPAHDGTLPACYSLLSGGAAISGVKKAEDGSGDIVVRIYDTRSESGDAQLKFAGEVNSAKLCSVTEMPGDSLKVSGGTVTVPLKANGIAAVRVTMK